MMVEDERVIEGLIQALNSEDWDKRMEAAEALGKIKDAKAVDSLIRALKDDEDGVVRMSVAEALGKTIEALGKIGDARAVQPLLRALKDEDQNIQCKAAEALGKIGDFGSVEAILDWLFANPFRKELEMDAMINLLGDYTTLILKVSFVPLTYHYNFGGEVLEDIEYDLSVSDRAALELCKISTRIASNILHKISTRREIKLHKNIRLDTIYFVNQRQIAINELNRRGNPPYDPSAYLDKEAWKL